MGISELDIYGKFCPFVLYGVKFLNTGVDYLLLNWGISSGLNLIFLIKIVSSDNKICQYHNGYFMKKLNFPQVVTIVIQSRKTGFSS